MLGCKFSNFQIKKTLLYTDMSLMFTSITTLRMHSKRKRDTVPPQISPFGAVIDFGVITNVPTNCKILKCSTSPIAKKKRVQKRLQNGKEERDGPYFMEVDSSDDNYDDWSNEGGSCGGGEGKLWVGSSSKTPH
jgi:hypothetical protein